jgi:hypothetical protein
MFDVIPEGILVFKFAWEGEVWCFPADLNREGDRYCHIESETEWQLNWTPDLPARALV